MGGRRLRADPPAALRSGSGTKSRREPRPVRIGGAKPDQTFRNFQIVNVDRKKLPVARPNVLKSMGSRDSGVRKTRSGPGGQSYEQKPVLMSVGSVACPACGAENVSGMTACSVCGARLAGASQEPSRASRTSSAEPRQSVQSRPPRKTQGPRIGVARRGALQGVARDVQLRTEQYQSAQSQETEQVLTFHIDRVDDAGGTLPPIPVEMRGRHLRGSVNDGDWIDVGDNWHEGDLLQPRAVLNLSTGVRVRARGRVHPVAGRLVVWVWIAILVAVVIIVIKPLALTRNYAL